MLHMAIQQVFQGFDETIVHGPLEIDNIRIE